MHHAGSRQIGAARRLLEQLDWWTLRQVDPPRTRYAVRVAALGAASDRAAVCYLPLLVAEHLVGMRDLPLDLPGDGPWAARYIDSATVDEQKTDMVEPAADGRWRPPLQPPFADRLLAIESTAGYWHR